MKKNSCFFAVRVGHLPGEQESLDWFKKEGFKIRPVHMDFKLHD
ncbi:TraB/GumN family protein [Maribellus comscasis]|nr:TraB/GumN family protein [Maribellus comscasis]